MAISFLDFFGSDPSKMDQTRKFGEQTSQILKFKPKELDFQLIIIYFTQTLQIFFYILAHLTQNLWLIQMQLSLFSVTTNCFHLSCQYFQYRKYFQQTSETFFLAKKFNNILFHFCFLIHLLQANSKNFQFLFLQKHT